MIKYEDVRRVHLELTDKCNVSCPMCIRNIYGGPLNPNILNTELRLEDIKEIFSVDFVSQLYHLYCCGNAGDPMLSRDLHAIFEYFREVNSKMSLGMHTHGSGRNGEWWYELGKILKKRGDFVRFSVDGLEDTNHIYRRGTSWDKIVNSMTEFVRGGGRGVWEIIPFKHNQHQIEEAKKIAKKIGLQGFQIIKTGRFVDVGKTKGDMLSWKNAQPVYSKNCQLEYIIEPADDDFISDAIIVARKKGEVSNPKLSPHMFDEDMTPEKYFEATRDKMYFPDVDKEVGDLPSLDNTKISCQSIKEKCIFITAEGYLFPCCWTAYQIYQLRLQHANKQMRNLMTEQGMDSINALKKPLKEIIESDWIQKRFSDRWKKKKIKDGKLAACATHCGEFSHVKNEYDINEIDLQTKVGFIGLGKLGALVAECMEESGHRVTGYDIENVDCNVEKAHSIEECINEKEYIFIAVPTPHEQGYGGETPSSHLPPKGFDNSIVIDVLKEISKHITKNQTVVLISTVLPGVVRSILSPLVSKSRFIYNPYLTAMGTVKKDMMNPEMIILGSEDGSEDGFSDLIDFYKPIVKNNPRYEFGTWDEAECIKIFYNTFISIKLSFVNMIQDVAERNGNINTDVVTNALAKSTQRIISEQYMKAGMGDGGPCHPRDNIALSSLASELELNYDLFKSIIHSREMQAKNMAEKLMSYRLPVVILGKSFKPNVPYIDGSYSVLVGHYIEEVYYGEPPDVGGPYVYLIGHRNKFYDYKFYPGSIIVDPWREFPDVDGCNVIQYGNTKSD